MKEEERNSGQLSDSSDSLLFIHGPVMETHVFRSGHLGKSLSITCALNVGVNGCTQRYRATKGARETEESVLDSKVWARTTLSRTPQCFL